MQTLVSSLRRLAVTGTQYSSVRNISLFPKCYLCADSIVGYVGWDPVESTVIVGHQGTDTSKMLAAFIFTTNTFTHAFIITVYPS